MESIFLFGLVGLLIVFMFFSNRKRQRAAQEMDTALVPGVEVMTGSGIFGTLVSLDEEDARALLEISPGVIITVHRQAIARVVPKEAPEAERIDDETARSAADAVAQVGEDTAVLPPSQRKPRKKPASETSAE